MNREIKFRAWDSHEKQMIYVKDNRSLRLFDDTSGAVVFNAGESAEGSYDMVIIGVNNPLMQYTGLKDKNGKDIYEGDILLCEKCFSRMSSRGTLRKKDPKQISGYLSVDWCDAGFHFNFIQPIDEHKKSYEEKKYTYAYIQYSIWDGQKEQTHVEVIGNIYEHPHLLNQGTEVDNQNKK